MSISPIVNNVRDWNEYAVASQGWVQESYNLRSTSNVTAEPIPSELYFRTKDGVMIAEQQQPGERYSPLWQKNGAAAVDTSAVNYNLLRNEVFAKLFRIMKGSRAPVLSEILDPTSLLGADSFFEYGDDKIHPESLLIQPIYESFGANGSSTGDVTGTIIAVIPWDVYFHNLLHEGASPILCVMRNSCGDIFSYQIDGPSATFLGEGDLHEAKYDYLEHVIAFGPPVDKYIYEDNDADAHCLYSLHIYPTPEMEDSYETNTPAILTTVVVLIFVFTSLVFIMYDFLVQRRQSRVQSAALKSNAIVSSLFPAEVRDRLFEHSSDTERIKSIKASGKYKTLEPAAKFRLKSYLDSDILGGEAAPTDDDDGMDVNPAGAIPEMYETKPIADLFPNTTVMFADISGFTAWSSVREPSQVFTLLETVYRAFDNIAKRRRVFKVETVGDCYVSLILSRSTDPK